MKQSNRQSIREQRLVDLFAVERRCVRRFRDVPRASDHLRLPRRFLSLRFFVAPLLRAFLLHSDAFDGVSRRENAREIEHVRFLRIHAVEKRSEIPSKGRKALQQSAEL